MHFESDVELLPRYNDTLPPSFCLVKPHPLPPSWSPDPIAALWIHHDHPWPLALQNAPICHDGNPRCPTSPQSGSPDSDFFIAIVS